tara:strand:+ start:248 stop:895 length:648 start_codon:yes stop_codon:yes gene_type:complete
MDITGPAKKLAQDNKIDYKKIKGSGHKGRVLVGDIKEHMKTKKVSPKTSRSSSKTKKKSSSSSSKTNSQSPKWNVKVSVKPYVDNNAIADIPIIIHNTKEFEKWINKKLPLINTTFSNIETNITNFEAGLIEIEFTITSKKNKEQLSHEIKEMLNINDFKYPVDVKFSGEITFVDNIDSYEKSPEDIPGYAADDTEPQFQEVKFKNIEIKKLEKI